MLGTRASVLSTLAADSYQKPALVEAVDVSRSTVDRAIDDLSDSDLVVRDEDGYRATLSGVLALESYERYRAETDGIAAARPILDALDADVALDPALLTGADITLAQPHAPESALADAVATLDQATTLRGFAPVIKSSYVGLVHDAVTERDLDVEIVVEEAVLESLQSLSRIEPGALELFSAESVTIHTTERDLPYNLWWMRGPDAVRSGITVHDDGGIVGTVLNDRPEALRWARERYEAIRDDAEELDPSQFSA